jgi:hypothetical protein
VAVLVENLAMLPVVQQEVLMESQIQVAAAAAALEML